MTILSQFISFKLILYRKNIYDIFCKQCEKLASPLRDLVFSVKKNIGKGTGIGKLIPIYPAFTSF